MPVSVSVEHPDENQIDLDPYFVETGEGSIVVKGVGNRVVVKRPHHVGGIYFLVQDGSAIDIGAGCVLGSLMIHAIAPKVEVTIGDRCGINGGIHIAAHETAKITVGNDCLFGSDVSISASDVHKIYQVRTGKRLNPAQDIVIGDRVWVAPKVAIFRGVQIGNDSIVGFGSIVKGRFRSNVIIAGAPARIVRRGIRWEQ